MPHNLLDLFLLMLVLSLPLLAIPDTESVTENLADALERHALDVGIAEDDEDPAEEADAAIEAKSTTSTISADNYMKMSQVLTR